MGWLCVCTKLGLDMCTTPHIVRTRPPTVAYAHHALSTWCQSSRPPLLRDRLGKQCLELSRIPLRAIVLYTARITRLTSTRDMLFNGTAAPAMFS